MHPLRTVGAQPKVNPYLQDALADLKRTLEATTEEIAVNRADAYFLSRSPHSKGIINVYYHLLTVMAFDGTKTLNDLTPSQISAPKVKSDLTLLENIRESAKKGKVEGIKEAIDAKFTIDHLKQLFHVPTWEAFFALKPEEIVAAKRIDEALNVPQPPVSARVDDVAKRKMPDTPVDPDEGLLGLVCKFQKEDEQAEAFQRLQRQFLEEDDAEIARIVEEAENEDPDRALAQMLQREYDLATEDPE